MVAIGGTLLFAVFGGIDWVVILASRLVGRWLGWTALALGLGGTITGVLLTAQGATDLTVNVLLRPLGMATTVYFIALDITIGRSRTEEITARRGPPPQAKS